MGVVDFDVWPNTGNYWHLSRANRYFANESYAITIV
jgi:hypothetical protein